MQLAGILNGVAAERGMTVLDGDCDVVLRREVKLDQRRGAGAET
jgi:hypothetical protein